MRCNGWPQATAVNHQITEASANDHARQKTMELQVDGTEQKSTHPNPCVDVIGPACSERLDDASKGELFANGGKQSYGHECGRKLPRGIKREQRCGYFGRNSFVMVNGRCERIGHELEQPSIGSKREVDERLNRPRHGESTKPPAGFRNGELKKGAAGEKFVRKPCHQAKRKQLIYPIDDEVVDFAFIRCGVIGEGHCLFH